MQLPSKTMNPANSIALARVSAINLGYVRKHAFEMVKWMALSYDIRYNPTMQ